MHTPFAPNFCMALSFLTNDESRPTSSTHRFSFTTMPLHVDSGNLKTSESKAAGHSVLESLPYQNHVPNPDYAQLRVPFVPFTCRHVLVLVQVVCSCSCHLVRVHVPSCAHACVGSCYFGIV